jgi:hypothetical protein
VVDVLFSQLCGCRAVVPPGVRSGEVSVFCCCFVLVLLLLVQAEGFPRSGLWEWRMSVDLRWSCALLLDL